MTVSVRSRNAQLTFTRANVTLQSSDLDKTSSNAPKNRWTHFYFGFPWQSCSGGIVTQTWNFQLKRFLNLGFGPTSFHYLWYFGRKGRLRVLSHLWEQRFIEFRDTAWYIVTLDPQSVQSAKRKKKTLQPSVCHFTGLNLSFLNYYCSPKILHRLAKGHVSSSWGPRWPARTLTQALLDVSLMQKMYSRLVKIVETTTQTRPLIHLRHNSCNLS